LARIKDVTASIRQDVATATVDDAVQRVEIECHALVGGGDDVANLRMLTALGGLVHENLAIILVNLSRKSFVLHMLRGAGAKPRSLTGSQAGPKFGA
jgi:hypothetical protein